MSHAAGRVGRAASRIAGRSLLVLAIVGGCTGNLMAQRRAQMRAGLGGGQTATSNIKAPGSDLFPAGDERGGPAALTSFGGGGTPTNWKEGLIIGTLVGALAIYHVGVPGIDSFTPRVALGLVLFGGLVGGVPGALIGDQFPKGPPDAGLMSSARLP